MNKNFKLLEDKIGYEFKNKDLLIEALTHSSYAHEIGDINSNERLEFLGDSVLSLVTTEFLYSSFPETPEGELTKLRASLVCTASLSGFAREIMLGEFIFFGKGEINCGGSERPSILENTFEALVAAVYLDGGIECARRHVLRFLESKIKNHKVNFKDYKTSLQEIIQQNPDGHLSYHIISESGPQHDKLFEAEVRLNSNVIGKGTGKTKKQAEQEAARDAMQLMGL